jgi:hypothetical protein
MIRRRTPLRRVEIKRKQKPTLRAAPIARRKRVRSSNAYMHPEVRKLVRRIHKRSRGICEAQICCGGNPVDGDPHHLSYAPFKGWKRLMVAEDQLLDCCRPCHLEFERRKGEPMQHDATSFLCDDA